MPSKPNPAADYKPNPKKVQQAQRALILAEGNVAEAARTSGISRPTFKRYLKSGLIDPTLKLHGDDQVQALDKLASDQNAELAKLMLGTAEKAVDQVNAELYAASAKDAAIIAGVMIDKSRILEGKATKRVEVDVSGSLEILRRHGIIIEADADDVLDAEVVREIEQ